MPQVIKTSTYLKGVTVSPNTGTPGAGNYSPPSGTGNAISAEELQRAKLRIKLTRFLDDGLQTLGRMEILKENGTLQFQMTSVELPYRGNANSISCIPPGKYLVRCYKNEHYGKCFWVYGNEAGNYAKNQLYGNGYIRGAVLIHRAPNSGWLMGCIGPGSKYSTNTKGREINTKKYDNNHLSGNLKGNPYGTLGSTGHGPPQKEMNRLVNSGLWQGGDVTQTSFYMTIENNNPLYSGENQASQIMDLKTGEPTIFIGQTS